MQVPRVSPRGWFWGLVLGAFLWAYVGTRTVGGMGGSVMLSAQNVLAAPVRLLVVPGGWIVTSVQGGISSALRNLTTSRHEGETMASLEEKNKKLEDDVAIRDGQIGALMEQIRNMKGNLSRGIEPEDVVRGYIVGRNMGSGSATLNIDKGTADGVVAGLRVIGGENNIIGTVLTADRKTLVVRLITDGNSVIRATIVRPGAGGTRTVVKECLVHGYGNGDFGTDTIKTAEGSVEKDDVVQLLDPQWPAKLQYFVLGVVSKVTLNPNSMLRYEVRNRANINDLQYVEVLTRIN